jgi:hypothetical protein
MFHDNNDDHVRRALDFDLEDELYMNNRHAVAMEALEEELGLGDIGNVMEELEEGEVPIGDFDVVGAIDNVNFNQAAQADILGDFPNVPHGQFGDDFILLPLLEEEWEPLQIERQNEVDPFQEYEEADDRARDEWRQRNAEIAADSNSKWEDINDNLRWTQRPDLLRFQWQFPSDEMMQIQKRQVVLDNDIYIHRENQRLLNPENRLPQGIINRTRGIYNMCKECNCCERHLKNRPGNGEHVHYLIPNDLELERGQKTNCCICPCRHIMRANICRLE